MDKNIKDIFWFSGDEGIWTYDKGIVLYFSKPDVKFVIKVKSQVHECNFFFSTPFKMLLIWKKYDYVHIGIC